MDESAYPNGFDAPRALPWIEEHVGPLQPPVEVEQLVGGRSNLTYRISDASGFDCVLRRPPMGTVLPTAHDMGREHRILAAVGPTDVPVPRVHGHAPEEDGAAEFYVMEHVEGVVLEDRDAAASLSPGARVEAARSLVDTLVALHRVDPDAVGLGELSRRTGYVERQLKRWHKQWELTKTEDVPEMDEVHAWLADNVPPCDEVAIVHGDFRFGNGVFGPDGRLRAVLDWELCTLGDPLADVGYMLLTWDEPEDEAYLAIDPPTVVPGFPGRREVLERYEQGSGRDLSRIDYYVTLQAWRLACINQGVYKRYVTGDSGMVPADVDAIRERIDRLVAVAVRGGRPSS